MLVAGAALVVALTLLVSTIVMARALTRSELVRDRATDCAKPATYATHSPTEIEDCVTNIVRADMETRGVIPALVTLQREANSNPMLKGLCHLSLHVLGRDYQHAGLRMQALDGPMKPDANWNSLCIGGFLHGYLQAMSEKSTATELTDVGRNWCTTLTDQNREGCAHAVGHGLSRRFRNDLRKSAARCDTLPSSVMSDCLSGAIMEINFANAKIRDRMKRNDPNLGPAHEVNCGMVAADQKNWCRAFVAKGVLLVTELRTVG